MFFQESEGRDRWRALVKVVMNLQILYNVRSFLTSWKSDRFSRRTLLHGVVSWVFVWANDWLRIPGTFFCTCCTVVHIHNTATFMPVLTVNTCSVVQDAICTILAANLNSLHYFMQAHHRRFYRTKKHKCQKLKLSCLLWRFRIMEWVLAVFLSFHSCFTSRTEWILQDLARQCVAVRFPWNIDNQLPTCTA